MIKKLGLALSLWCCTISFAEDGWMFTTFLGHSFSANNHIHIHLEDQDDISKTAEYNTRPFVDSPYYIIRFDKWKADTGWGIELIHHKIYMANRPSNLEHFSLSDGFNLLLLNRNWKKESGDYRIGAGATIAHPDVKLQGRERFHKAGNDGFFIVGPTFQASHAKQLFKTKRYIVSLETKATIAYFKTRISDNSDEYVEGLDTALHIALGFGSKPIKTKTVKNISAFMAPALWLGAGLIAAPLEG